jgi:hypothetical protein
MTCPADIIEKCKENIVLICFFSFRAGQPQHRHLGGIRLICSGAGRSNSASIL